MNMTINALFMYGLPFDDLDNLGLTPSSVRRMMDDGVLQYAIPYHGAPRKEWFVGVLIDEGCGDENIQCAVNNAVQTFDSLTQNLAPNAYLQVCPHVF